MKCQNCNSFTENKKFCSISCSSSFNNKLRSTKTKKNCIQCGEQTKNPKFCSRSCAASYNNRGVSRNVSNKFCLFCKKLLTKRGRKYCSRFCYKQKLDKLAIEKIELGIAVSVKTLKNYLLKQDASCSECGLKGFWNGKPLTLHMDHIDGNSDNNHLSNLRLLCPNCHSQTETYVSRNIKNTKRQKYARYIRKRVQSQMGRQ